MKNEEKQKVNKHKKKTKRNYNSYERKYAIISYLRWNLKEGDDMDPPRYTNPDVQEDFSERIRKSCRKKEPSGEDVKIVKILVPLIVCQRHLQDDFRKKIREACEKTESSDEDTEIVKFLAPLTDNPNASEGNMEKLQFIWAHFGDT